MNKKIPFDAPFNIYNAISFPAKDVDLKKAWQLGARFFPDYHWPSILDTCDTVIFDSSLLEKTCASVNTKHLDTNYLFEHLPFTEVVFIREDGRVYYFERLNKEVDDLFDFVIGYGPTKDVCWMTGYCIDRNSIWQPTFPDGSVPVWVCDNTGKVAVPGDPNTPDSFAYSVQMMKQLQQKRNVVLTLLFCMTLIPAQHLNRTTVKKKVKTVKRNNGVKTKNYRKISQTVVTIDPVYTEEKTASIEREFTADYWNVRGHYRRYKSGKVIWIKPHRCERNKLLLSERSVTKQAIAVIGGPYIDSPTT